MPAQTQCGSLEIIIFNNYALAFNPATRETYLVVLDVSTGAKSPVAQVVEAVSKNLADPIPTPLELQI